MTASRLVLWRHGRTAHNSTDRFQGQLDTDLDEVGRRQAEAAAEVLAGWRPDALVSSDLRRARDTAQALARRTGLAVTTDSALREIHAGAWQGLTRDEIISGWESDFAAWRRGEDVVLGGGEKRSQVAERTASALQRHADALPEGSILVAASHGGALRAGLVQLLGLPGDAYGTFAGFRNAHWAVLERVRQRWVLAGYNLGTVGSAEGVEG